MQLSTTLINNLALMRGSNHEVELAGRSLMCNFNSIHLPVNTETVKSVLGTLDQQHYKKHTTQTSYSINKGTTQ